ncbi:MAG: hypothetical protein COW84_11055 [Gammaproteobacteria bacterium CG22_combo_CG10-13_8_21_14_all_40_8]|nr:MAG: hypothetical protein COW84_11055 [Gammaproteobacteria bacterium CG22_combo_CG10-13_8_21_14_all_40_8]
MLFNEDPNHARFQIRSYGHGEIKINELVYTTPIVVTPEQIVTDILPSSIAELNSTHFEAIQQLNQEIYLIGTGETQMLMPKDWMIMCAKLNLTLDVMKTQAACRTYRVLSSEGRPVAAVLFP